MPPNMFPPSTVRFYRLMRVEGEFSVDPNDREHSIRPISDHWGFPETAKSQEELNVLFHVRSPGLDRASANFFVSQAAPGSLIDVSPRHLAQLHDRIGKRGLLISGTDREAVTRIRGEMLQGKKRSQSVGASFAMNGRLGRKPTTCVRLFFLSKTSVLRHPSPSNAENTAAWNPAKWSLRSLLLLDTDLRRASCFAISMRNTGRTRRTLR